ncbi:MAG: response regulator transcription factor [Halarcobacter sp.]
MIGTKILFLEDDTLYQESIKDLLEDEKFLVDTCTSGQEFLNKTFENVYDLYILDLNVPEIDGFNILKILKEYNDRTMKLVLSSIPNTLIESFKNGCDDYLNKNTDIEELIIRIKVLIKRAYHSYCESIILTEHLKYNLFDKKLLKDQKDVHLEIQSLFVLDYLIKRRGEFVSNYELEKNTYPCDSESKSNVIRYHIWNLRNRLGKDLIESQKNIGYRLKPLLF